MNNKVDVSVILPSLNVSNYIWKCVESVINQTLDSIEIICVDAGSTDGTLEILKEYEKKDCRVRVVVSEKKSYGHQINLGIDMAKGDYIGIVETDDYIDANMYMKLFLAAQQTDKPDFVKGEIGEFADNNDMKLVWKREQGTREYEKRINLVNNRSFAFRNYGAVWDGIYRKDFLNKNNIRMHESLGAAYQDTSFLILTAAIAESAAYIEDVVYYYRIDNQSSSVKQMRLWKSIVDEFEFLKIEIEKRNIEEVKNLVELMKQKTFWWNYKRLSNPDYRSEFITSVRDELSSMRKKKSLFDLDEINQLDVMLQDLYTTVEENNKKNKRIIDDFKNENKKYIIVSAGVLCSRLLFIQQLMGSNVVIGIGDNDPKKIGKKQGDYEIQSIQALWKEFGKQSNIIWIIANKKHTKEIEEQLINIGITEGEIDVISSLPEKKELYQMVFER